MDEKRVNLPQTDFSMKANLAQKEPVQQEKWARETLYEKMLEKNKGNKSYMLHDGPPYANGHIHLGHALNKVLKDIIVKYESMQGKYTPYIPGWDCHGLPIEFQLLKEMKKDKNSVDQLDFRRQAAAFAKKYIEIQKEEFKRLGIFGDWDHPYLTLDPQYESVIIRVFRELVNKGYVYRGMKPVYWCARCETALAEAEVEYENHSSPSVFVKFPVEKNDYSIVIWTTTPWTLPANVAVAFHPDADYAVISVDETTNPNCAPNEKLLVGESLLETRAPKLGITRYTIVKRCKGKDLEGIKCASPFRDALSVGVCASFVTLDDGTGIVHIAPGHGEDDYAVGTKYGLPVVTPVDDKGRFTDEVPLFKGVHVFKANPLVIQNLDERKLLLHQENIEHSYPHCWRCKQPIVFRATSQWFLSVDAQGLRQKLLDVCKQVTWIPDYGLNRITGMIEGRPDWCVSRQRLWGVPIPAFYCTQCGTVLLTDKSIAAVESLFAREGSDSWFIKQPEEILPSDSACACGSHSFKKETDILDVWFDSGVSHEAVLKHREGLQWPADLYLEGSDQHRGWFQTSLIPSVALHGKAPYKTVLTHGFTVDGEGKKMSKSLGNVIAPQDLIKQYGADIVRLWIASEDYRDDMRISGDIVKQLVDAYRKIRNTARYMLGNLFDYNHANDAVQYDALLEIDQWALSKLSAVTNTVEELYNKREFHAVYRTLYTFCTIELSALYFDILKDRLYVSAPKSVERRSAQTVLYYLVSFLTRMLAPIIPFTAEEIWNCMPQGQGSSVFLADFPSKNNDAVLRKAWASPELVQKWDEMFALRSVILKKIEEQRLQKVLGNSLEASVTIQLEKPCPSLELTQGKESVWATVCIVSQVEFVIGNVYEKDAVPAAELPASLKNIRIGIQVSHARGHKCSRCWNWHEGLAASELCPRCEKIVKEWK